MLREKEKRFTKRTATLWILQNFMLKEEIKVSPSVREVQIPDQKKWRDFWEQAMIIPVAKNCSREIGPV